MPQTISIERLADDVLTFIEQHESEQISYGIYDVTMTAADLIDRYSPIDSQLLETGAPPIGDHIHEALQLLATQRQIIRFDQSDAIEEWIFRSRIAEIARLLTKLRQRIATDVSQQQRQRISGLKRLVADVKLHVAPRRVPDRATDSRGVIDRALGDGERALAATILKTAIDSALRKLHVISGFQERAFTTILRAIELDPPRRAETGVVVTAGTGAGKTYAFFLPLLAKMIIERSLRNRIGVKAICIYPRVALSENQLEDFVEALFYINAELTKRHLPNLTVGIESGAAIYRNSELGPIDEHRTDKLRKRGWRPDPSSRGYIAPFAFCVGKAGYACSDQRTRLVVRSSSSNALACPICETAYPFVHYSREEMAKAPPDLLIATTESLNRRLTSSDHQYLFGTDRFCAPSVVMLDEIHLQTSTSGTQVALLLRRLLARIRLGRDERGERENLAFVGLSATIAQPTQFVADLTGLDVGVVREVRPQEDELRVIGAERFIFVRASESEDTAVISTLIQTAMCVLHNMPQPVGGDGPERYRAFGFVESLDLVGRWNYQMVDAERQRADQKERRERYKSQPVERRPIADVPLYAYRLPPHNRKLFPNLFGAQASAAHSCGCEHGQPDRACPYFASGECWWSPSQPHTARPEPLNIIRKTGGDRDVPIEDSHDLIITTSALEVGYDDDALMCVIQYTAPKNVASFVQRKGRGGRKVGTRPITVTVLSPYKTTDLFVYRNHHLLTDPTFTKLPLNAQNRFLQRIHGFYALFDLLAYRASRMGRSLRLDSFRTDDLQFIMEQTSDLAALQFFRDYMRHTFGAEGPDLAEVLTEDGRGVLPGILGAGVKQTLYARVQQVEFRRFGVRIVEELRGYLPSNLFSDINLPEVQVSYNSGRQQRPSSATTMGQSDRSRPDTESISLALSETIPGNVTFRGRRGAVWIPPVTIGDETPRIPVAEVYHFPEGPDILVQTSQLSPRALRSVGISARDVRALTVRRPDAIRPQPFSEDMVSSYWYGEPSTGNLMYRAGAESEPQHMRRLAHSSAAYPVSAVAIHLNRDVGIRYRLNDEHPTLRRDPFAHQLISKIELHSDLADNMSLVSVRRIILGSSYTLKFHQAVDEEFSAVAGFCRSESDPSPVALGYEIETEGVCFTVKDAPLAQFTPSAHVQAAVMAQAVRYHHVAQLTEGGANFFAADNLTAALLTVADLWRSRDGQTLDVIEQRFVIGNPNFDHDLAWALTTIHRLSTRKQEAVKRLLSGESDTTVRSFVQTYVKVHRCGDLYARHLRDTLRLSLTVALKQVAQEVAGVEALSYIAAWTELESDYEGRAQPKIWLYEIGMGGIGVMRATHERLLHDPQRFWSDLAAKAARCTTAQEERMLRLLLAQPLAWLAECEQLVGAALAARSSLDRQRALAALLAEVRRQLRVPVAQRHVRAILRVFAADYEAAGAESIGAWQLYWEINTQLLPECAADLGRTPSFAEASAMIALAVQAPAGAQRAPNLAALLAVYRSEYGPPPGSAREQIRYESDVTQALQSAIERRLLITCQGCCPNCLDDKSGDVVSPSSARLLLSRDLMAEWIRWARRDVTLTIAGASGIATIAEEIAAVFMRGVDAAYLRAPASQLDAICRAISYLSDAGVELLTRLAYPMISDLHTTYADDRSEPMVDVTIRLVV